MITTDGSGSRDPEPHRSGPGATSVIVRADLFLLSELHGHELTQRESEWFWAGYDSREAEVERLNAEADGLHEIVHALGRAEIARARQRIAELQQRRIAQAHEAADGTGAFLSELAEVEGVVDAARPVWRAA